MRFLGIDIGVRNLAFCMFEEPTYNEENELVYSEPIFWKDISILDELPTCQEIGCERPSKWSNDVAKTVCGMHKKRAKLFAELTELTVRNVDEYTPFEIQVRLIETLDKHPELYDVDYIFIENQPKDNGYMKAFAASVFTYFTKSAFIDTNHPRLREIAYISASKKTKKIPLISDAFVSTKKGSYAQRKETAIVYCREYCGKYMSHLLPYFDSHRKKDDLSDSFLMCIAGMWSIHIRDVYGSLETDEIHALCTKHKVVMMNKNGKCRTKKQLLAALEKDWVWAEIER
jgi:hypothetical protein